MNMQAHPKQEGLALVVMTFFLASIAFSMMLSYLNQNSLKVDRDKKSFQSLSEAKTALIGWSIGHATMPGTLPCPDIANSGTSGSCTATTGLIGRLPFKTLGVGDLRDASGECLWYALSPVFRNTIAINSRPTFPLSKALGAIDLKNKSGNVIANNLIAVIFSPGPPIAGQLRTGQGNTVCGGNTDAKNYLDRVNGISNSDGGFSLGRFTFAQGPASNFNDKVAFITVEDLYKPLNQRIIAEAYGTSGDNLTYGLRWYFNKNNVYPWAADASYNQQNFLLEGKLAYLDLNFTVSSINQWLTKNNWWPLIKYKVSADSLNVMLSIDGGN